MSVFKLDYSENESTEEVIELIIDRFILIMAQISGGVKNV